MTILRRSLPLLATLVLASVASAHVNLIAPNGGEVLNAGSTFNITWKIQIAHSQKNWDLEYSTTGLAGPWIPIATDLPPGSFAVGSQHAYLWTIPDTPSTKVRVRVTMDNQGTDYFGISLGSVTIIGTPATDCNANGELDTTDIALGTSNDFDGNGQPDECQSLAVDAAGLSIATGGAQSLTMDLGPSQAGSLYLILGTLSGSSPGTPIGPLVAPLNFDAYTLYTLTHANLPPLVNTLGTLDANGTAVGKISIGPAVLSPAFVGLPIRHAAIILGAVPGSDAVTNWMPLTFTP